MSASTLGRALSPAFLYLFFISGCLGYRSASSFTRAAMQEGKTPLPTTIESTSLRNAQRVQELGQRILEQNTFTGLTPLFHHVNIQELLIFHRGSDELFISDGLIRRCNTEEELAAVLCRELGQMLAEKRMAKSLNYNTSSVPETAAPPPLGEGIIAASSPDLAGNAHENASSQCDPIELAQELLKGAGFDPQALNKISELTRELNKHPLLIARQISAPAQNPQWNR